ncbi:MAG: hypothetical protein HOI70_12380, partial [Opitutae bacterium]|nr:hypothetical protein [Opitutae bacterium]
GPVTVDISISDDAGTSESVLKSAEEIRKAVLKVTDRARIIPYVIEPLGAEWEKNGWNDMQFMTDIGLFLSKAGLDARNAVAYREITDRHLIVKVLPLNKSPRTPFHIEVKFNRFLGTSAEGRSFEYPVVAWERAGIDEGSRMDAQKGIDQFLGMFVRDYMEANPDLVSDGSSN